MCSDQSTAAASWAWRQILGRGTDFCLQQNDQTGAEVHPASYAMGVWDYFAGIKPPGA